MNQESRVINKFTGKWKPFSNFYPVIIEYMDFEFPTVEHAYVASKSKDPMFRSKISRLSAKDAGLAKFFGRKVKLIENWSIIKISNMSGFLMQKFNYPELKELLLSTGDIKIIETNYWHDNFWGDCICKKCVNIEGQNMLGKLIMKVRGII